MGDTFDCLLLIVACLLTVGAVATMMTRPHTYNIYYYTVTTSQRTKQRVSGRAGVLSVGSNSKHHHEDISIYPHILFLAAAGGGSSRREILYLFNTPPFLCTFLSTIFSPVSRDNNNNNDDDTRFLSGFCSGCMAWFCRRFSCFLKCVCLPCNYHVSTR